MTDIWLIVTVLAGAFVFTALMGDLTSGGTMQSDAKGFKKKRKLPVLCRLGLHKIVSHLYSRNSPDRDKQLCLRCGLFRQDLSGPEWFVYHNVRYVDDPHKLAETWRSQEDP